VTSVEYSVLQNRHQRHVLNRWSTLSADRDVSLSLGIQYDSHVLLSLDIQYGSHSNKPTSNVQA